jgi:hypothetical protein
MSTTAATSAAAATAATSAAAAAYTNNFAFGFDKLGIQAGVQH